jgi:CubicO group peptidase (beta-lactamase class C family)
MMKLNMRWLPMVVAGAALITGCGADSAQTPAGTHSTESRTPTEATPTLGPFPAQCYAPADTPEPGDGNAELVRNDPGIQAALAALDSQIDAAFKEKGLPSVAIGVVYDQGVLWSRGYGFADIDAQRLATPGTVYRIGSNTKMFTATMLLQLRDAGKLLLDEPLAQYAPEVTLLIGANSWPQPTFREAASHTAGLAPNLFYVEADRDVFLAKVATTSLDAEPGSGFAYSNLGFQLLGYTLEVIAAEPYRQYVTEHILRPLGMESSGFDATAGDRLATGYAVDGAGERAPVGPFDLAGGYMAPAGALYSSVDDMAKFVELQFRSGPAAGAQILSSDSLRELRRPNARVPDDNVWGLKGACYGLGTFQDEEFGHAGFGHIGRVPGYASIVWMVPDLKLGIIVLANQIDYAPAADIANMIRGALTPALGQALGGE